MIGLFMKIPFHSQIRRAEPSLAAELSGIVDQAVADFAASRPATEESFFLVFEESSRPCRLRAAEAARSLAARLSGLGPRLHGWALLLDIGSSSREEALLFAKRLWFGVQGDGLYLSARSKEAFADYFLLGPSVPGASGEPSGAEGDARACIPVLDAVYARAALPLARRASEALEEAPAQAIDRLVDAIGELGVGLEAEKSLAVLGPGRGPRHCLESALSKLYSESSSRFLRLPASAVESAPYGPVARALSALVSPKPGVSGPGALLSGAERGLLEELAPILDFLQRSPYRRGYSTQIVVRLRLCAAAALRLYARDMRARGLPAFVILDQIHSFPEPSLALVYGLVAENLDGEGLAIIATGSELPSCWPGSAPRSLEVAGPAPAAIAEAALSGADSLCAPGASPSLALAAAGDPQRLRLALRLLSAGRGLSPAASTERLAAQALATFPREYAELLCIIRLGEETLTDECMDSFLNDSGYVPGIRGLICESLAELGLITRGGRPRVASAAAIGLLEEALPDGGAAVRAQFADRLLRLREEGRIIPSIALYRRSLEGARANADPLADFSREDCALALDCILADAVYGPSEQPGLPSLAMPLAPLTDFLGACAAGDRAASLAALLRLEAAAPTAGPSAAERTVDSGEEFASTVRSLARAAFEYADGRAQGAAALAKRALMSLHALGVRTAEAKAHRILGLCSLAQEQAQESAGYLANAYDIATALPEPLECILSAVAEAAASFAIGDLGRASSRADAAAAWATSSFRADWESACAFIKGRAALEIGQYEEAEEHFGRVRTVARVYGQADASRRAEIWTGRAAAYSGEAMRARETLGRFGGDVEALWFLAELEAWEGSPDRAARLASEALDIAPRPGFFPAEAFDWGSGYSSLEGRAIGFYPKRSYLYDQVEAFREFAAGMAAPETEGPARAARLAALVREDRLAVIHPAAHLYLFYRYLILERTNPGSMDGATALSKAFKALQLRSTRMGEAAQKDGFLGANRWNRGLIEAARLRKLI